MSKELHIALQNAIGDLGTDVLKSPFLVNILQDYGAFDGNDKHNETTRRTFYNLVVEGRIGKILSWQNLQKEEIQSKGQKLLRKYDDNKDVRNVIDSVMTALEMPTVPKYEITNTQKSNRTKESILQKKWVRTALYILTTLSVMILCSSIFNVYEWKVWDGLLILPIIGVIGVIACVVLPTGLLIGGFYNMEEKTGSDKEGICTVLGVINLVLIPILLLAWDWNHLVNALIIVAYITGIILLIGLFFLLQDIFNN